MCCNNRISSHFRKFILYTNSRSIKPKYFKQAMCPTNLGHKQNLGYSVLLQAKQYISDLKDKLNLPIFKSKRKTGFMGFVVCIESTLAIYSKYVAGENSSFKYLPLYKISQDHLERLFGYIRARGGNNNNPTCREFTGSLKRILLHKELQETDS